MTIRVGINGFGRIGRTILRASLKEAYKDIEIVHINDLTSPETNAHLLKYDSVHGTIDQSVQLDGTTLILDGKKRISVSSIKAPSEIPWKEKNVDIVFECTGFFKSRSDMMEHLKGGAKKVLISAPATDEDITVVYGVNSDKLKQDHVIVSNGSCTTNCLAPLTKIIHESFKVKSGLMTTVHSYTNDQKVLDVAHSDLRRARAAALSMIPTSTGAAKAIGLVLPELKGLIDGLSVRVPTPNVSLVDVTFQVEKETSKEDVNRVLKEASQKSLKGILAFCEEPLVSSDFNGNPHSSIIDASMTKVISKNLVKVLSWYDNETGFSVRMLDVARLMMK